MSRVEKLFDELRYELSQENCENCEQCDEAFSSGLGEAYSETYKNAESFLQGFVDLVENSPLLEDLPLMFKPPQPVITYPTMKIQRRDDYEDTGGFTLAVDHTDGIHLYPAEISVGCITRTVRQWQRDVEDDLRATLLVQHHNHPLIPLASFILQLHGLLFPTNVNPPEEK